jgi:hypothetical protein
MGIDAVAKRTGIKRTTLQRVRAGVVATIPVATADAILACPLRPALGALAPSYPTRRLLRDLLREEFTLTELARRLGWSSRQFRLPKVGSKIRLRTAAKVKLLYNRITAEGLEEDP